MKNEACHSSDQNYVQSIVTPRDAASSALRSLDRLRQLVDLSLDSFRGPIDAPFVPYLWMKR